MNSNFLLPWKKIQIKSEAPYCYPGMHVLTRYWEIKNFCGAFGFALRILRLALGISVSIRIIQGISRDYNWTTFVIPGSKCN